MKIPNELRSAALAEFKDGGDWSRFIDRNGAEIRTAEPFSRSKYHRLRGRLLALVTSGSCNTGRAASAAGK